MSLVAKSLPPSSLSFCSVSLVKICHHTLSILALPTNAQLSTKKRKSPGVFLWLSPRGSYSGGELFSMSPFHFWKKEIPLQSKLFRSKNNIYCVHDDLPGELIEGVSFFMSVPRGGVKREGKLFKEIRLQSTAETSSDNCVMIKTDLSLTVFLTFHRSAT